jgi:hypothetical protein
VDKKIHYTKPKVITCYDCESCYKCPEWSRLYPCRDFKPTTSGKEGDYDKSGIQGLPQKQADH